MWLQKYSSEGDSSQIYLGHDQVQLNAEDLVIKNNVDLVVKNLM